MRGSTKVLRFGLTENDVRIRTGTLEDVRLGNDKQNILGLFDSHTENAGNGTHTKLLHGLAGLFLGTVLLGLRLGDGGDVTGSSGTLLRLEFGDVILVVINLLDLNNQVSVWERNPIGFEDRQQPIE